MRTVFAWFGWEIYYVCEWGEYSHRYDSLDLQAMRPIHRHMSVAPPWAERHYRRIK